MKTVEICKNICISIENEVSIYLQLQFIHKKINLKKVLPFELFIKSLHFWTKIS